MSIDQRKQEFTTKTQKIKTFIFCVFVPLWVLFCVLGKFYANVGVSLTLPDRLYTPGRDTPALSKKAKALKS